MGACPAELDLKRGNRNMDVSCSLMRDVVTKGAMMVGGVILAAAMSGCALPVRGTSITDAAFPTTLPTSNNDARIEAVVRETLRKHPALVRDALNALQETERVEERKRALAMIASQRAALHEDSNSPVGGNPAGDVTVVQFFDYRCSYCKRVLPTLVELIKRDSRVRLVYKEFPVLGPESHQAALAALAAQRQGKYLEFHHALMSAGEVSDSSITRVTNTLGMDQQRFRKDIADPALMTRLEANHALGKALGINGTPAFVIGDQLVPGAAGLDDLLRLVGEARSGQVVRR